MINKGNFTIRIGDKVLPCKVAKLTLSEDEASTKEFSTDWATPISPKSYELSTSAFIKKPGGIVRDMLNDMSGRIDVTIQNELKRMPRKMKKGYRSFTFSDSHRDTKWKRKAINYVRRNRYHMRNAEVVVTPEYRDKLTAIIKADKIECGDCSAVIDGGQLRDVLNKISNPKK